MISKVNIRIIVVLCSFLAAVLITNASPDPAGMKSVKLTIHLRGVYSSKITLMTQFGGSPLIRDLMARENIMNGDTSVFTIQPDYLPGEFVLRFDYKEESTSNPYPAEKSFLINNQDLELWVHPIYSNNADSSYFQKDEKENTILSSFMKENYKQKEIMGMLQNFLLNYDDNKSSFYQEGIKEYEKRRKAHNAWIAGQVEMNRDLFASSLFRMQYVSEISWKGSEDDRKQSYIDHYFDNVDFNDSLLIRVRDFKSWMDQYVNLYGEQATTNALRDSLFTLAGKRAIELAKSGHPKVYGWMVDYFYKGYESFNIEPGIAMLAPYLDDPNCLTSKKQAIMKRVEGMKTLTPGTMAPDFIFKDYAGNSLSFQAFQSGTPYKLVLFWSADCSHCMELVNKLYTWYQKSGKKGKVSVFPVSLDETETEVAEWESAVKLLPGWFHTRAEGGVNSTEADNYYILATPVMVLVNAASGQIIDMPETVEELDALVQ